MTEPRTAPPPSPEARALRAIGAELDVMSEVLTSLDTGLRTLAEMSGADGKIITGKLDLIIKLLTGPEEGLLHRVAALEAWRGEQALERLREQVQ